MKIFDRVRARLLRWGLAYDEADYMRVGDCFDVICHGRAAPLIEKKGARLHVVLFVPQAPEISPFTQPDPGVPQ